MNLILTADAGIIVAAMKIAVISDIHSNLDAFLETVDVIDRRHPDLVVSLGDNIGYGPDPEAVMALIRSRPILSVLGNHEMALIHPHLAAWFNPRARISLEFTRDRLSDDSMQQIRFLPRVLVRNGIRFVHGCPDQSVFLYLFQVTRSNLKKKLAALTERLCFVGHTHDLGLVRFDPAAGSVDELPLGQGKTRLDPEMKYIVSAGSVGQPRDGNRDAKLVLLDTRSLELDVRFIPYNRQATIEKMTRLGLPPSFAEKLI